jgi:hypothetical protein
MSAVAKISKPLMRGLHVAEVKKYVVYGLYSEPAILGLFQALYFPFSAVPYLCPSPFFNGDTCICFKSSSREYLLFFFFLILHYGFLPFTSFVRSCCALMSLSYVDP